MEARPRWRACRAARSPSVTTIPASAYIGVAIGLGESRLRSRRSQFWSRTSQRCSLVRPRYPIDEVESFLAVCDQQDRLAFGQRLAGAAVSSAEGASPGERIAAA